MFLAQMILPGKHLGVFAQELSVAIARVQELADAYGVSTGAFKFRYMETPAASTGRMRFKFTTCSGPDSELGWGIVEVLPDPYRGASNAGLDILGWLKLAQEFAPAGVWNIDELSVEESPSQGHDEDEEEEEVEA